MRKLIAMLLALTLCLSLAACGGSGSNEETQSPEGGNAVPSGVEDGVLTVNQSGTVMPGSVGFRVGDSICWNTVKAHPPVSLVAPSGLVPSVWPFDSYPSTFAQVIYLLIT